MRTISLTVTAALLVWSVTACDLPVEIQPPVRSPHALATALGHDAQFLNQLVPLQMLTNESRQVAISFENTGTVAWGQSDQHRLGLVATPLPASWGMARVQLPTDTTVEPGETATFIFSITAPATPGQYDFEWRMLQELVEWFGTTSPVVRIEVLSAARQESLCAIDGGQDAASQLQQCLDAATASTHQKLFIPVGVYELNSQLDINGPVTLATAGTSLDDPPCRLGDPECATLIRGPTLPEGGMVNVKATDVWIDHLVFDGNRQIGGDGSWENVRVHATLALGSADRFRFTNNVSHDTIGNGNVSLPGWTLPTEYPFLYDNLFAFSGAHGPAASIWSDAIRVGHGRHLAFVSNTILDGTDIDIITGEGGFDRILHNRMVHTTKYSGQTFASIMLNDWKLGVGEPRRDIHEGTEIAYNHIECSPAKRCGIGILVGRSPWTDPAGPDVVGTVANPIRVHDNIIRDAQTGLSVDDAEHVVLYNNLVSGSPVDDIHCHDPNSHPNEPTSSQYDTFAYNISADSSSIDRSNDQTPPGDYVAVDTSRCIPCAEYPEPSSGQDSLFVWQEVPGRMTAGESYQVAIMMTNTGAVAWSNAAGHSLGSEDPRDNLTWGTGRVALGSADPVAPGEIAQFVFEITAPTAAGVYSFQWRMLQTGVEWLGQFTNKLMVIVEEGCPPACEPDGGSADGGLADGGLPDGGLPDGGLADGGLPDGGLPDGGLADGGLPDGGSGDEEPAGGDSIPGDEQAMSGDELPAAPTGEPPDAGCSCRKGHSANGSWAVLLGLFLVRRRRVDHNR